MAKKPMTLQRRAELLKLALLSYCRSQGISRSQLSEIVDANVGMLMSGVYLQTSDAAEALQWVFWIIGLNEANPVYFGISQNVTSEWIRKHAEFAAQARERLYDYAVVLAQRSAAQGYQSALFTLAVAFIMAVGFTAFSVIMFQNPSVPVERVAAIAFPAFLLWLLTIGLIVAVFDKRKALSRM